MFEDIANYGAVKLDQGKAPLTLISVKAQLAEAQVLDFGAQKYGRHQWRKGIAWDRLLDAAQRHINAFVDGEDNDPESGLSHLAHARASLGFLLEYLHTHPELDNRHSSDGNQA